MRISTVSLGGVVLGAALGAVALTSASADVSVHVTPARVGVATAKLRADLGDLVARADADRMIPISIVLREPVTRAELEPLTRLADRDERRARVMSTLRTRAAATNAGLLRTLEEERARGTARRVRALWITNVVAAEATPEVILRIAARDDVALVNYDRPVGPEVLPVEPEDDRGGQDPRDGGTIECGVDIMRAPEVWETYGFDGSGVVVGIIDTGACLTHPDIESQIWNNDDEVPDNGVDDDANGYVDDMVGWNFRDQTNDVADTNGHGTHTAGTVAGDGAQGEQTGMAPGAELQVLKFLNSFSGESIVWEAMEYAVANDADIITASIGWPHSVGPDRARWREVCENAIAAGVVVIYAAGNEGGGNPPDNVRTPGDVPDMITIGATDCSMNIASFSSRGPITWQDVPEYGDWPYPPGLIKPTVSAPGVNTLSLSVCSGYRNLSGTSMATPHVAGAAALMLEANPNLDHFDVMEILEQTAIDRGAEGNDNDYGYGFVDAFAAVEVALESGGTPGDVNGDGFVNFEDILAILGAWGPCEGCPEDANGDGFVNFEDILVVLSNWS